jgi:hypothetical protein
MINFNYNLKELLEPINCVKVTQIMGLKINICAYQIIETEHSPFLQYLLFKEPTCLELDFPSYYMSNLDTNSICTQSVEFLKNLLKDKMDNKFNMEQDIHCNGYLNINNDYYIFYDLTGVILDYKPLIFSLNPTWFAIIDEILNVKHICGIPILDNVTSVFEKNTPLVFLYNSENDIIKSPKIGYIGRIDKYLHFTYTFGVSTSLSNSLFGELYYYTSFENSFKNNWIMKDYFEQDLENKPEIDSSIFNIEKNMFTHGIVRSVLFFNNTIMLNNIKVNKDDFYIDFDNNITFKNQNAFKLDPNWTSNYDSLILTDLIMDYTKKIKGPPIYVLTDINQQFPISYHYYKPNSNNINII